MKIQRYYIISRRYDIIYTIQSTSALDTISIYELQKHIKTNNTYLMLKILNLYNI